MLRGVDSLQGQLLVSSPALVDPNFRRTVVLVGHHDEEGALGVVLSRPSSIRAADAVPELAEIAGDEVVYNGGPVEPSSYLVLAEFEDVDDAAAIVTGTVGFVAIGTAPEELAVRRLRVFVGYSGWGPGQLEDELGESSWIVVPAEPDDAFVPDPDELWRDVLARKGSDYALIATMPFNPRLN
jgi:putative transcriptional regulator